MYPVELKGMPEHRQAFSIKSGARGGMVLTWSWDNDSVLHRPLRSCVLLADWTPEEIENLMNTWPEGHGDSHPMLH